MIMAKHFQLPPPPTRPIKGLNQLQYAQLQVPESSSPSCREPSVTGTALRLHVVEAKTIVTFVSRANSTQTAWVGLVFLFSAWVLTVSSLGTLIAALTTAHWIEGTRGNRPYYAGLFQFCIQRRDDEYKCQHWDIYRAAKNGKQEALYRLPVHVGLFPYSITMVFLFLEAWALVVNTFLLLWCIFGNQSHTWAVNCVNGAIANVLYMLISRLMYYIPVLSYWHEFGDAYHGEGSILLLITSIMELSAVVCIQMPIYPLKSVPFSESSCSLASSDSVIIARVSPKLNESRRRLSVARPTKKKARVRKPVTELTEKRSNPQLQVIMQRYNRAPIRRSTLPTEEHMEALFDNDTNQYNLRTDSAGLIDAENQLMKKRLSLAAGILLEKKTQIEDDVFDTTNRRSLSPSQKSIKSLFNWRTSPDKKNFRSPSRASTLQPGTEV